MKVSADWGKEIVLVNPALDTLERRLNCQRCVVAFEYSAEDIMRSFGDGAKAVK